jgi:anti-sigma regulatory factor (Ser/Thr protein kinase)
MNPSVLVEITDDSTVGEARRRCAELASRNGFDESSIARVSIVATEIASNLFHHGERAARVLARAAEHRGRSALEILGVDAGPGIANITDALRDGYSTAGTAGSGLGAVQRLSDVFQVYSLPDVGTVVLARIRSPTAAVATTDVRFDIGVVVTPKPGQDTSGDDWAVVHGGDRTWIMVADGLGHGPGATLASAEAGRVFREGGNRSPEERLMAMQGPLRSTRGAAVAVAEIRSGSEEVVYAGLGNIAASVVTPAQSRGLISHDGIVGHVMSRVQEFTVPFPLDALLVMHTDGVGQRWDLEDYPGITKKDPAIIAAVLHRSHVRSRDDALVLVARGTRPAGAQSGG